MPEIKQFNLRVSTEAADRFRAFCESEGWNQAQGFGYMLEALELNQAKAVIPSRETEIADFESHAKAIMSAFIRSLEISENAETRVRDMFAEQIANKERPLTLFLGAVMNWNGNETTPKKKPKTSGNGLQNWRKARAGCRPSLTPTRDSLPGKMK